MVAAASSAVKSLPSWKVTPSWRVKVQAWSSSELHSVASFGSSSPVVGFRSTSGSVMVERSTTPVLVRFASHGSSVGGSCWRTTRRVSEASPDPAAFSELATEQPLSSTPVPRAAADRDTSRRGRPGFGAMVVAAGRGRSNVMVSSENGNRADAGLDGLLEGCPAAGRMDSVGPAHTAVKEPDGRDGAPDGRGGAVRCGRRM